MLWQFIWMKAALIILHIWFIYSNDTPFYTVPNTSKPESNSTLMRTVIGTHQASSKKAWFYMSDST